MCWIFSTLLQVIKLLYRNFSTPLLEYYYTTYTYILSVFFYTTLSILLHYFMPYATPLTENHYTTSNHNPHEYWA